MQLKDELNIEKRKDITKLFEKDEIVIFSAKLQKINVRKKKQERLILLTNKNLYNLKDGGFLTGALSIFSSSGMIKRKIPLNKIKAIVYAKLGNEFVINVPSEFDWRIISEKKDIIIVQLLHALSLNGNESLLFYFNNEIELHNFTTHGS
jgi:hypothetical protein